MNNTGSPFCFKENFSFDLGALTQSWLSRQGKRKFSFTKMGSLGLILSSSPSPYFNEGEFLLKTTVLEYFDPVQKKVNDKVLWWVMWLFYWGIWEWPSCNSPETPRCGLIPNCVGQKSVQRHCSKQWNELLLHQGLQNMLISAGFQSQDLKPWHMY